MPTSLQVALFSLGKDFLPSVLRGLANDPAQIVVHILMALHDGLLSDEASSRLPRSKVVGFFSEWVCKELLVLYEREDDLISVASSKEKHSIADVIHHFMLALCTHPGRGVCYVDDGWYGKKHARPEGEEEDGEEGDGAILANEGAGGVYNKILLGLLKSLSPTRSPKQAELTLRILTASQELIAPYLLSTTGSLSSASLEPRGMSIAWLSTATFLGRILSIPLPDPSHWKQAPPSLDRCLETIMPTKVSRALLTRGIHHKDRLTRHGALTLLCRILARLHYFTLLCSALHERRETGQLRQARVFEVDRDAVLRGEHELGSKGEGVWLRLHAKVLDEAKQLLPDLTAILAAMDVASPLPIRNDGTEVEAPSVVSSRASLLIEEVALRAACLHHEVFEKVTTIDISKLLSSTSIAATPPAASDAEEGRHRLSLLCQLHTLQLLASFRRKGGMRLDLFSKQNNKETSHFSHLLRLAVAPMLDLVGEKSRDLIKSFMTSTILFDHNTEEWDIWQFALDTSTEEELDFFEECAQRCLKTPYRYIEASRRLACEADQTLSASPVLTTMMEQYLVRMQNGLFGQSPIKVAFLRFLTRLFPLLLALNLGPSAVPKLFGDFEAKCRATLEAITDAQGDAVLFSLSAIQTAVLAMTTGSNAIAKTRQGVKHGEATSALSKEQIRTGLVDASLVAENLHTVYENVLAATSGTDIPLPPTIFALHWTGAWKEDVVIDWNSLLTSPLQTKVMLTYCRNAILSESVALNQVQRLLKATLEHGAIDRHDMWRLFLQDKELELDWRQRRSLLTMLISVVRDAPLTNDETNPLLCFSLLLAEAVEAYYPDDSSLDSTSMEGEKGSLLALFPLLADSQKLLVMTREKNLHRLAQQMSSSSVWLQEPAILDGFIERLMQYADISTLRKAIVLLQHALQSALETQRSPLVAASSAKQQHLFHFLLSCSGVAELDAELCNLLVHTVPLARIFWTEIVRHVDRRRLVACLPKSVREAAEQVAGLTMQGTLEKDQHFDWCLTAKDRTGVIEDCLRHVFVADQAIAIPLSKAGLVTYLHGSVQAEEIARILDAALPSRPADAFKPCAFLLVQELITSRDATFWLHSDFLSKFLDQTLLWLVRRFAEDREEREETRKGVEAFLCLLRKYSKVTTDPIIKTHLVEPVLSAAVSNRLGSRLHIELIRYLIKLSPLKQGARERFLSAILTSREATGDVQTSKQVVKMVFEAVRADDSFASKPSLTSPLIKLYQGSLSQTDRMIMDILRRFESTTKTSALSLLQYWNLSSTEPTSEVDLGILSRMDPHRLYETSVKFPRRRGYEDSRASGYANEVDEDSLQEAVYDPLFVLAVVGGLLADVGGNQSLSGLQWLELVRTNALGVVACCLSSTWASTRAGASALLAKVYAGVASANFQEKEHLLLMLDAARNSYSADDVADMTSPAGLPLTTTLFVAHSLRSLGIPSLYLYPLVSRFLLQRPLPDPTDIPLLYNFLYSSSAQSTTHKSERIFILRFLLTCVRYGGKVEWNIMRRRHVWDSLCTLYAVNGIDLSVKRAIQDIFTAVTRKPDLAHRVVHRHAWLDYVAQVVLVYTQGEVKREEHEFWVHCLANLADLLDFTLAQSSSCFIAYAKLLETFPEELQWNTGQDLRFCLDVTRLWARIPAHLLDKRTLDTVFHLVGHSNPDGFSSKTNQPVLEGLDEAQTAKLLRKYREKVASMDNLTSRTSSQ